jgi:hypothetical protein
MVVAPLNVQASAPVANAAKSEVLALTITRIPILTEEKAKLVTEHFATPIVRITLEHALPEL